MPAKAHAREPGEARDENDDREPEGDTVRKAELLETMREGVARLECRVAGEREDREGPVEAVRGRGDGRNEQRRGTE